MPEEAERKLKATARKRGWTTKKKGKTILTERGRKYVYGTLRKLGWKPSHQKG